MPDQQSNSLWNLNTASVFAEAVDLAAGSKRPETTPSSASTTGLPRRLATSSLAVLLLAGVAFVAWVA
jgi:hypothetical protein